MAGNTFGQIYRLTAFGESHGGAIGVVVDGCPAGLELAVEDVQKDLDRRRPGQSEIVTPRNEADKVEFLSGVFEGKTLGTPICMIARNEAAKPGDYDNLKDVYRPSHADYTYARKYGVRDYRGGGRSSARVTWASVAAGAVARKYLSGVLDGFEVVAWVDQVGDIKASVDMAKVGLADVEASMVRCPDGAASGKMIDLIKEVRGEGDTIGGIVKCVVRGVPVGLGEPIYDKLSADLAKAMMGINAVKGFEIGSGFGCVTMRGSEHNDEFVSVEAETGAGAGAEAGDGAETGAGASKIHMRTNHAGGVLGGISSGEDIYFGVAFKPVATLMREQKTVNEAGENVEMRAFGRHDACVLPRAVPIVEAMALNVLMDHYLRSKIK